MTKRPPSHTHGKVRKELSHAPMDDLDHRWGKILLDLPNRTFRNFRAKKSVNREMLCWSETWIDGFKGSKIVKCLVRWRILKRISLTKCANTLYYFHWEMTGGAAVANLVPLKVIRVWYSKWQSRSKREEEEKKTIRNVEEWCLPTTPLKKRISFILRLF